VRGSGTGAGKQNPGPALSLEKGEPNSVELGHSARSYNRWSQGKISAS